MGDFFRLSPPLWHPIRVTMRGIVLVGILCVFSVNAADMRSYVDNNGTRVLTNLPSGQSWKSITPVSHGRPGKPSSSRKQRFLPLIERISAEKGVDVDLVEAIIQIESNFDPRAVSVKNCKGLMQLHPDTARRFGVQDVFDPEENIRGGVAYLRWLLDHFDEDLTRTVAAYNAGENAVAKHGGVPPYRETRDYLQKVSRLYSLTRRQSRTPSRRIHRIETDDGRVIYTNTPWVVASR